MLPGEEHIAFYHAIGIAVTAWSHVENELFHVALGCFAPCKPEQVGSGFYAIENFRSKLAFVDRVFQATSAKKEFLADWTILANHVQGLSSKRNALAHSRVIVFPEAPAGRRYAIMPNVFATPKKKTASHLPPVGSLCVRDVDLIAKQFFKASARLSNLYARMIKAEGMPEELVRQEAQALSLAQLRRQIYALSPRRDKLSREKS